MRYLICGCLALLISCSPKPVDTGPGTIKWMVPTDRIGWCSPAIGPDGAVYIGDNEGTLYAVRDLGDTWEFIWKPRKIDRDLGESCPTITRDGKRLYIGSNTRPASMYCVNTEDGSVYDFAVVKYFYVPTSDFDNLFVSQEVYIAIEASVAAAAYDMNYSCRPAVITDATFTPPGDVEFLDLNQLMQGFGQ